MAAVLKCKMCGGDLEVEGAGVATCLYCGSTQLVPRLKDERKTNLYDRANHYRSISEFDKASAIYEQILVEDNTDAEVYWDIVLCRYGIEYVEDPKDHQRIPTVNRTQLWSVLEDKDYKKALEYASDEQKHVVEEEASRIDKIQRDILDISNREQPYDIFICYKETDENGRRTADSVMAQELYNELVKEGYKVFFSRITLEDKIGSAYEPYIFAALRSAKVMVVVGTSIANFNAVWVKNEWKRYLSFLNNGEDKVLIPAYKGIDPYDLPEEFAHLQAQDMDKLGFMQDLVRGINKIVRPEKTTQASGNAGIDVAAYKQRVTVFLENGEFQKAKEYCDKVLDVMPNDGETYVMRLCAEVGAKTPDELGNSSKKLKNYSSYQNAVKFGDAAVRDKLDEQLRIVEKNASATKQKRKKFGKVALIGIAGALAAAVAVMIVRDNMKHKQAENAYKQAEEYAAQGDSKGAREAITGYEDYAENSDLNQYLDAVEAFENGQYEEAKTIFKALRDKYNAKEMMLKSEYYSLEQNLDADNIWPTRKRLTELLDEGIKDVDDLEGQITIQTMQKCYDVGQYLKCTYFMNGLEKDHAEVAEKYRKDHQEEWYNKAMDIQKEILNSPRESVGNKYEDMRSLMELCGREYKDAGDYMDILTNAEITCVCAAPYVQQYELADFIMWNHYNEWFKDNWTTADGSMYFKVEHNDYGVVTHYSYNLPWFDAPNSFCEIDSAGTYYVYDADDTTKPPRTARDMYKFSIITEDQVEVYCCVDGSKYTLYKK